MSNELRLDPTDRAILAELVQDGRLSNVDLARRVRLTPAPCLRRVKRLEDDGVITGYAARLDPDQVGRGFAVFLSVEITMTNRDVVERFEVAVASFEEVTEIRRVYGPVDYLMQVEVGDNDAYERFLADKLYRLDGVRRIVSYPTMKLIKRRG